MRVLVSGRQLEITDALRDQVVEKIGRPERHLDGLERAEVHFREEHHARPDGREVCEVTMEGHGAHVRCKVPARDPFTAVDLAVDKLDAQLRTVKERTKSHGPAHRRSRTLG